MKNKILSTIALVLTLSATSLVHAGDASEDVSVGAASMAASPLLSIKGDPMEASGFFVLGAAYIVIGVGVIAGDTISLVIQNSVDGSKAVVRTSVAIAKNIGVSVGSTLKVVAESTGYTLIVAGKVLAFVPNAVGKELLHQSKLSK